MVKQKARKPWARALAGFLSAAMVITMAPDMALEAKAFGASATVTIGTNDFTATENAFTTVFATGTNVAGLTGNLVGTASVDGDDAYIITNAFADDTAAANAEIVETTDTGATISGFSAITDGTTIKDSEGNATNPTYSYGAKLSVAGATAVSVNIYDMTTRVGDMTGAQKANVGFATGPIEGFSTYNNTANQSTIAKYTKVSIARNTPIILPTYTLKDGWTLDGWEDTEGHEYPVAPKVGDIYANKAALENNDGVTLTPMLTNGNDVVVDWPTGVSAVKSSTDGQTWKTLTDETEATVGLRDGATFKIEASASYTYKVASDTAEGYLASGSLQTSLANKAIAISNNTFTYKYDPYDGAIPTLTITAIPISTENATVTLKGLEKGDKLAVGTPSAWVVTAGNTITTPNSVVDVDPASYSTYELTTKFAPKVGNVSGTSNYDLPFAYRDGYDFLGWKFEKDNKERFAYDSDKSTNYIIADLSDQTGSITLYPVFKAKKYTLVYHVAGNETNDQKDLTNVKALDLVPTESLTDKDVKDGKKEYTYGSISHNKITLATYTQEGYIFNGWTVANSTIANNVQIPADKLDEVDFSYFLKNPGFLDVDGDNIYVHLYMFNGEKGNAAGVIGTSDPEVKAKVIDLEPVVYTVNYTGINKLTKWTGASAVLSDWTDDGNTTFDKQELKYNTITAVVDEASAIKLMPYGKASDTPDPYFNLEEGDINDEFLFLGWQDSNGNKYYKKGYDADKAATKEWADSDTILVASEADASKLVESAKDGVITLTPIIEATEDMKTIKIYLNPNTGKIKVDNNLNWSVDANGNLYSTSKTTSSGSATFTIDTYNSETNGVVAEKDGYDFAGWYAVSGISANVSPAAKPADIANGLISTGVRAASPEVYVDEGTVTAYLKDTDPTNKAKLHADKDGNIILYALYTPHRFEVSVKNPSGASSVKYNSGNIASDKDKVSIPYDKSIAIPAPQEAYKNDGYKLAGWVDYDIQTIHDGSSEINGMTASSAKALAAANAQDATFPNKKAFDDWLTALNKGTVKYTFIEAGVAPSADELITIKKANVAGYKSEQRSTKLPELDNWKYLNQTDVNFYPVWVANEYTLNLNLGDDVTSIQITDKAVVKDQSQNVVKATDNTYSFTYDGEHDNGNGGGKGKIVLADFEPKLPSSVAPGWKFLGWYEASDTTYTNRIATITTAADGAGNLKMKSEINLVARWTQVHFYVKYVNGAGNTEEKPATPTPYKPDITNDFTDLGVLGPIKLDLTAGTAAATFDHVVYESKVSGGQYQFQDGSVLTGGLNGETFVGWDFVGGREGVAGVDPKYATAFPSDKFDIDNKYFNPALAVSSWMTEVTTTIDYPNTTEKIKYYVIEVPSVSKSAEYNFKITGVPEAALKTFDDNGNENKGFLVTKNKISTNDRVYLPSGNKDDYGYIKEMEQTNQSFVTWYYAAGREHPEEVDKTGDPAYYAKTTGSDVTVNALYAPNTYYLYLKDAKAASGAVTENGFLTDDVLPDLPGDFDDMPEGMSFRGWDINGKVYPAGTKIGDVLAVDGTALTKSNWIFMDRYDPDGVGPLDEIYTDDTTAYIYLDRNGDGDIEEKDGDINGIVANTTTNVATAFYAPADITVEYYYVDSTTKTLNKTTTPFVTNEKLTDGGFGLTNQAVKYWQKASVNGTTATAASAVQYKVGQVLSATDINNLMIKDADGNYVIRLLATLETAYTVNITGGGQSIALTLGDSKMVAGNFLFTEIYDYLIANTEDATIKASLKADKETDKTAGTATKLDRYFTLDVDGTFFRPSVSNVNYNKTGTGNGTNAAFKTLSLDTLKPSGTDNYTTTVTLTMQENSYNYVYVVRGADGKWNGITAANQNPNAASYNYTSTKTTATITAKYKSGDTSLNLWKPGKITGFQIVELVPETDKETGKEYVFGVDGTDKTTVGRYKTNVIGTLGLGQDLTGLTKRYNGHVMLVAQYETSKFTVKFDKNEAGFAKVAAKSGAKINGSMSDVTVEYGDNNWNGSLSAIGYYANGYTIIGWAKTEGATAAVYNAFDDYDDVIIGNSYKDVTTLYAVWQAKDYTVIYHTNGGTIAQPQTIKKFGESATLLKPTQAGYVFDGWFYDNNYKNAVPSSNSSYAIPATNTEEKIDVYAKWAPSKIKVTYNKGTGEGTNTTVEVGYCVPTTLAANTFTKKDHVFAGWSGNDGKTYIDKQENVEFAAATTLTAQWKKAGDACTITLKSDIEFGANPTGWNGSGKSLTATYKVGEGVALPTAKDVKAKDDTNYTFVNWKDANGVKVTSVTKATAGNLEYTAVWKAKTYKITYHKGTAEGSTVKGTTGNKNTSTITYGTEWAPAECGFTAAGYTFAGWATSETGAAVYNLPEKPYSMQSDGWKDMDLYATWKAVDQKIYLLVNNGYVPGDSNIADVTASYNGPVGIMYASNKFALTYQYAKGVKKVKLPASALSDAAGLTFAGWKKAKLDAAGRVDALGTTTGKVVTEVKVGTGDVYIATWKGSAKYTYYNTLTGETNEVTGKKIGATVKLTGLTKKMKSWKNKDYYFAGWSTDNDSIVEYKSGSKVKLNAGETTFYAVFESKDKTYTANFYDTTGNIIETIEFQYKKGIPAKTLKKLGKSVLEGTDYTYSSWATSDWNFGTSYIINKRLLPNPNRASQLFTKVKKKTAGNLDLYVVGKPKATYKITLDRNDIKGVKMSGKKTKKITLKAATMKDYTSGVASIKAKGYTLLGYSANPNYASDYITANYDIVPVLNNKVVASRDLAALANSGSTTLYAVWMNDAEVESWKAWLAGAARSSYNYYYNVGYNEENDTTVFENANPALLGWNDVDNASNTTQKYYQQAFTPSMNNVLPTPNRAGYKFAGWLELQSNGSWSSKVVTSTVTGAKTRYFKATWTRIQ